MEKQETTKKDLFSSVTSGVFKLRNFIKKRKDPNFKRYTRLVTAGHTIEGFTKDEELHYRKRLSLAEKGTVPINLRAAIMIHKDHKKRILKDQEIAISSIIQVKKDGKPHDKVLTGFDKNKNRPVVSYRSINGIPEWESLNFKKFQKHFKELSPSQDGTLDIQTINTKEDLRREVQPHQVGDISKSAQELSRQAYLSNKYFKKNESQLPVDIADNSEIYKDKVFNIQVYKNEKPIALRYKGEKEGLHSFARVLSSTNNTSVLISDKDLRTLSQLKNINVISDLNHGYKLGFQKGEFLYQNSKSKDNRWKTISDITSDITMDKKVSNYLIKEVHTKHNFYVKNSGMDLNKQNIEYQLRKHQSSGLMHYRKMDSSPRISLDNKLIHEKVLTEDMLPKGITFSKKMNITIADNQPVAQRSDLSFTIESQGQKEIPFAKEIYDTRLSNDFDKQYSINQYDTNIKKSELQAKSVPVSFQELGRNAQQLFIYNYMLREEERSFSQENKSFKVLNTKIVKEMKTQFPENKHLNEIHKNAIFNKQQPQSQENQTLSNKKQNNQDNSPEL